MDSGRLFELQFRQPNPSPNQCPESDACADELHWAVLLAQRQHQALSQGAPPVGAPPVGVGLESIEAGDRAVTA